MKIKISLAITALLILFAGCSGHRESNIDPVKYGIKYYDKQFGNCDTNNVTNCVNVNFEYPEINYSQFPAMKDSVGKYVNEFMLQPVYGEKAAKSFDEISDAIIREFKDLKKNFPEAPAGFELQRTVTVMVNHDGFLGLEFNQYSFLGGAHPNTTVHYENFNGADGEILKLSDLFLPGFENALNEAGEKEFRKLKNLDEDASLEKAGYWFKNNKFVLNDNFLIMKSGIRFYFNSYEIAPYSMGATELVIPYDEIDEIIKEEGPLGVFPY